MALYQDIYGWEIGANYGIALGIASATQAYISDGTANTGCYYGKCLLRSSNGYSFARTFSPSISVTGNSTGTGFEFKVGLYFRIATYPNQNGTSIIALGNGAVSPLDDIAIRVNTDGSWEVYNDFLVTPTNAGTGTIGLNTWYYVTLDYAWKRNWTADSEDHVSVAVNITGVGTASVTGVFANLFGSTVRVDRIELGTKTTFNASGSVTAGEVHFDDLVFQLGNIVNGGSTVPALPASTRIRAVRIEGQGSHADWTGSYTLVQAIPPNEASGQTSTVAAQSTTFTHSSTAQFNFANIDVVKAYADAKCSVVGPLTENILLNGTSYPVSLTNAFQSGVGTPMAVDWNSYSQPTFDAAEFGCTNTTGASLTLAACLLEVLYTGGADAWFGCNAPTGTDPNYGVIPGCIDTFLIGPSTGGSGCTDGFSIGSSSGGSGCVV